MRGYARQWRTRAYKCSHQSPCPPSPPPIFPRSTRRIDPDPLTTRSRAPMTKPPRNTNQHQEQHQEQPHPRSSATGPPQPSSLQLTISRKHFSGEPSLTVATSPLHPQAPTPPTLPSTFTIPIHPLKANPGNKPLREPSTEYPADTWFNALGST